MYQAQTQTILLWLSTDPKFKSSNGKCNNIGSKQRPMKE